MGNQPSTPKITDQDRAIFQLKQQRDKIKQHQRKLTIICNKQTELAKKAISNDQPQRAKFYLRCKKNQESTINKTFEQLDNLEKLIGTIEFKLIEKDVMYGLQQGNQVLRQLNNEMNVEKIDKIMDDLEEEKLKEEEISQTLGLGSGLSRVDEDAIEREFAKLDQEIHPRKEAEAKKEEKVAFPDAPTDRILPKTPSTLEEREKDKEKEQPKANGPIAL
ncbi:Vps20 ESCRT III complex protein [Candida orthopsilosis Co 90-125]|uniref:Vps20 ESCRT III complex protein n=1 Tax=Candida orthopsilosis (strain 90-125) TaxID=1136231 RepID=H8WXJ1_CANO9|nr:Vps20 ESCRT III complex protein [Candida orthopsilosis Co 90-125]CCG21497.1 Vps20 ESCRT III complex protein [Candida orthopsilosis Co 90-125]